MSGILMNSPAPTRVACGATSSESPPGGWPLGRWPTPGAGWVSELTLIGSSVEAAGLLFSARPYRPPDAACVTGRNGCPALTVRVAPAAWAGAGAASPQASTAATANRTVRLGRDTFVPRFWRGVVELGSSHVGRRNPDPHR